MIVMTNEEKMSNYMQRNVKLYPPLLAFTWDVIFVWTISTMFFTAQKGLSFSQVVLLDSILMGIGCLICIPVSNLLKNVNSVRATQIGSLGYAAYLLLCIFGTNFGTFVFAQFFMAFAYIACGIKGNSILTQSLSLLHKDNDYDKVYGKGMALLYVVEAVGAIGITYVYNWKPYLCYWISFGVVAFVFLYGFLFVPPEKFQKQNIVVQAKDETASAKKVKKENVYLKILKSPFFISLLAFMFMMRGSLSIVNNNFKMYLQQVIDVGLMPAWLFGYIYAIGKLCAALSSKFQFKFNLKFNVRCLIIFAVSTILSFVLPGAIYLLLPTNTTTIVLIVIFSLIQMSILQPCRIFVNNYMQVCISPKDIEQAYSVRTMVEYLGYSLISALYSLLLSTFNDNYGTTSLVFIAIVAVPIIVSMIVFIKFLIKKHAQKYTIIKDEYSQDD